MLVVSLMISVRCWWWFRWFRWLELDIGSDVSGLQDEWQQHAHSLSKSLRSHLCSLRSLHSEAFFTNIASTPFRFRGNRAALIYFGPKSLHYSSTSLQSHIFLPVSSIFHHQNRFSLIYFSPKPRPSETLFVNIVSFCLVFPGTFSHSQCKSQKLF